jgi:sterol desaturase/sphingolipid hydroxylase (fatty acid hydroxylase superfamily)
MKQAILGAVAQLKQEASAGKPPETVRQFTIGFLVALILLATLFWVLERWFPADAEQPRVSPRSGRPALGLDLSYVVLSHITEKVFGIVLLPLAIVAILVRLPHLHTALAAQPIGLQALEILVTADFVQYWTHRSFHEVPSLWRLHSVHHSSLRLDWLAGARVHPLEGLLGKLVPFSVIFWMGFSMSATALFGPLFGIYGILLHANVKWDFGPLRWVLASPAYHRWHHSADAAARDKNFAGIFPVLDMMFGTAHFPKDSRPEGFGLGAEPFPETLRGQLMAPFRASPR